MEMLNVSVAVFQMYTGMWDPLHQVDHGMFLWDRLHCRLHTANIDHLAAVEFFH